MPSSRRSSWHIHLLFTPLAVPEQSTMCADTVNASFDGMRALGEATAEERSTCRFRRLSTLQRIFLRQKSATNIQRIYVSLRPPHSPVTSSCATFTCRSSTAMLKISSVFLRDGGRRNQQGRPTGKSPRGRQVGLDMTMT